VTSHLVSNLAVCVVNFVMNAACHVCLSLASQLKDAGTPIFGPQMVSVGVTEFSKVTEIGDG